MNLVQLIVPVESAHQAMLYLGDLGLLQFKDVSLLYTERWIACSLGKKDI